MKKRPIKSSVFLAILMLGTAGLAQAEKKPLMTGASAEALSYTCMGCHGTNGVSNGPSIPSIAGNAPAYFTSVMEGYQSGSVYSTIMGRIAKGYNADEIAAMGEFFAKQKHVGAPQEIDAKLAKEGAKYQDKYCDKCHSEGGSLADDEAGILAGQWMPYIEWTLADVSDGKREVGKKMAKKLKKLTTKKGDPAHIRKALAHYYASQK